MPETAIKVSDPQLMPWYRKHAIALNVSVDDLVQVALEQFKASTISQKVSILGIPPPVVHTMATAAPPMVPTASEDLF